MGFMSEDAGTAAPGGMVWKLLLGVFLMVVCGMVVGSHILERLESEQSGGSHRLYLEFLKAENRATLDDLSTSIGSMEEAMQAHEITYRSLQRGTVGLGIRRVVEESLLELTALPEVPRISYPEWGVETALLEAHADPLLKMAVLKGELSGLRDFTNRRAAALEGMRHYLFEEVVAEWRNGEDGDFSEVHLRFDFNSLANDRKLLNLYFDVIRWNREWLSRAHALQEGLETFGEELEAEMKRPLF